MSATRILGVDIGSRRLGLAFLPVDRDPPRRPAWTYELADDLVGRLADAYEAAQIHVDSNTVVVPELPPMVRSAEVHRVLCEVLGAFKAGCGHALFVHPGLAVGSWKRASVGVGNASKDQVRAWAWAQYGVEGVGQDALDALGVAHAGRLMWATRREAA